MSVNPIKLWPGPTEDGRETYFATGHDVPDGWEIRRGIGQSSYSRWRQPAEVYRPGDEQWYQTRPPALLPG